MSGLEPRLSQFGPALNWLMARGVSSSRLASLFGTTQENIRVITLRTRRHEIVAEKPIGINEKPNGALATRLGIRPALDDAAWSPGRNRKLDSLRAEVDRSIARFSAGSDVLEGVGELRRILPRIGYAGDARRIALAAHIHERIAGLLSHSARSLSAARQSAVSQDLWRIAWHETGDRTYAAGFVRAALIQSNSWLMSRMPTHALTALDLAHDAASSIGAPLGSDHFRQRGVALLQLRYDQDAMAQFRTSAERMEKMNEATVPAQILMTGPRYLSILGDPNCDQAMDVLATANSTFGEKSLETSMALHWAAASCFCSDSPSLIEYAESSLLSHPAPPLQFGHQTTIRRLLLITPDLGLDDRLRRIWVRRALYENAFQNR